MTGLFPTTLLHGKTSPVSQDQTPIRFDRPEQRPSLQMLAAVNRIFTRCYHRLEPASACPLPRRGPAILVCNHTSGLDPLLLQSTCARPIVWMMAHEYYQRKSLRWIFRLIDAIPVSRDQRDLSALRMALRALRSGRILGIFPEGRIETDQQLLPFQTGVALLMLRSGASIYPAYLNSPWRETDMLRTFLFPRSVKLTFGAPLHAKSLHPHHQQLDAITAQIQSLIEALRQQSNSPTPAKMTGGM
ncbi:MAG: 1-acyl-sn-glycerol-3-phosphate acyltransferase [Phycisphaerales bacterium]|nr:1-acyl-sn-glycerol-3-phosphate acyltransferase [Phycisphaerales bacterium]